MSITKTLLVAFALAAAVTPRAQSATYYVDPNNGSTTCGNTGHSGCNSTACRSFGALDGVATFASGDVVNFCAGTFRETVRVTANGMTLRRAPGVPPQGAVVSALNVCSSWNAQGSGVFGCPFSPPDSFSSEVGISQLFIDGTPIPEYQAHGCPSPVSALTNLRTCQNYPAKTCSSASDCSGVGGGACVSDSWCWTGATLYVHKNDGSSPAGDLVEAGARHKTLDLAGRSGITVDGLKFVGGQSQTTFDPMIDMSNVSGPTTLTNNVFDYASGMGILTTTSGDLTLTATANTFSNIGQGNSFHGSGVASSNGTMLWRFQAANRAGNVINISNNTLSNIGTHNWARGVGGGNCGTVTNSDRCWMAGFQCQACAGRVKYDDNNATNVENFLMQKVCTGIIQSGSSVSRNDITSWPLQPSKGSFMLAGGIRIGCEHSGSACTGSMQDCALAPTRPVWHELRVERNRIVGGQKGIWISASNPQAGDDFTVGLFNNMVKSGDHRFGWNSNAGLLIHRGSSGIKVYNNTLQCLSSSPFGGAGISIGGADSTQAGGNAGIDFKNNLFDLSGCDSKIADLSSMDTWSGANVCDAAYSGCATGAANLSFANEEMADFTVTSDPGSAVTDRGTALSQFFTTDFEGQTRPVGSAWDIGAGEGGSGVALAPPVLQSVVPLP